MTQTDPPPPRLEDLARRTMDLWREQMDRMAHDPETIELMTRIFALMTEGAQALRFVSAAQGSGPAHKEEADHAPTAGERSGDGAPGPEAGAASAANVFGAGGGDPVPLHRRIADLEARLEALERLCAAHLPRPEASPGDGGGV